MYNNKQKLGQQAIKVNQYTIKTQNTLILP